MPEALEEAARALVNLINDGPIIDDDDPKIAALKYATSKLDMILTDISKTRADHPKAIEHAKKIAAAFAADFMCDDEPQVELGEGTEVWVQCWMLVKTDPDTGNMS